MLCFLPHAHYVLVLGGVDDQTPEAELIVF